MSSSEEGSHDWNLHLRGHLGVRRWLLRRIHARLLVIERRRFRRKNVNPTDVEFKQTQVVVTVACIVFGAAFLCVALLSTIFGDSIVNAMFHSFGG
jgi:Trk-type K+ transport system membrane component